MRTRGLCPLALLVGLVLPLFGISAQSVRGTVVNERSAPVPGVIVLLLDDASNVVARTLSGGSGEFRLLASRAGSYRTRTLRIGFRPMLSATFQLAAAQEIMQRLTLSSVQFTLDTVKVLGRNEC
ncbi:MAG: carboxypeptidase-like regulatory domain-containing protein, partial [Gemmatimonas sp.]